MKADHLVAGLVLLAVAAAIANYQRKGPGQIVEPVYRVSSAYECMGNTCKKVDISGYKQ